MKYKGYEAIVEYDDQDCLFVGRVINTLDVIAFDGLSVEELESSFHTTIDQYLEDCRTRGKTPDKAFSKRLDCSPSPF
jgi:predicted HicB family RNase H-like nuclease